MIEHEWVVTDAYISATQANCRVCGLCKVYNSLNFISYYEHEVGEFMGNNIKEPNCNEHIMKQIME